MQVFKNPNISIASGIHATIVRDLLNISYRGEASKQGWTTEAAYIAGDTRADENMISQVMQKSGSVFLINSDEEKQITGCVNLQQHDHKIYLGMFAVLPNLQGVGIGKQLLYAAEEYAHLKNCTAVYMSVISLRTELINWYIRHGYADTGERIPFIEDGITGKHLRQLEFMILEKSISP